MLSGRHDLPIVLIFYSQRKEQILIWVAFILTPLQPNSTILWWKITLARNNKHSLLIAIKLFCITQNTCALANFEFFFSNTRYHSSFHNRILSGTYICSSALLLILNYTKLLTTLFGQPQMAWRLYESSWKSISLFKILKGINALILQDNLVSLLSFLKGREIGWNRS